MAFSSFPTVLATVTALNSVGSWSGNTHVQKCVFFLKHLTGVEVDYDFTIHKFGPYSFSLDDDLGLLVAFNTLHVRHAEPAGVHYSTEEPAEGLSSSDLKAVHWVAETFGRRNVKELELLATTYFAARGIDGEDRGRDLDRIASYVLNLKPHFTRDDVAGAYSELLELEGRAPKAA